LVAALAGSGFGLQPTGGGETHILVADGESRLPVPQELRLAIDFGYDRLMSSHGLASLATQAGICHHLAKQHGEHVTLALCGLEPGGAAAAHVDGAGSDTGAGGDAWGLRRHASLADLAAADGPLVYLSPDADETLECVRPEDVYVIGGLIDRKSKCEGASLARAKAVGARAARLPIVEHLAAAQRLRSDSLDQLNVNAVFHILVECAARRDWPSAIAAGLAAGQRGYGEKRACPDGGEGEGA